MAERWEQQRTGSMRGCGVRGESLRVIQVACAEAQCAQTRGRTRPTSPRDRLKMAVGFCLSVQTGGGYFQASLRINDRPAIL